MNDFSVTNEYAKTVCKIGQGAACCRFLVVGSGFECAKLNLEVRSIIDKRTEAGTMVAKGDNCDGKPEALAKFLFE